QAFIDASVSADRLRKIVQRAAVIVAFVALSVALAVIFNAYRKAAASAEEARLRHIAMREEQTRLSLLEHKPLEALAYLNDAASFGGDDEELRQMGGVLEWLTRGRGPDL